MAVTTMVLRSKGTLISAGVLLVTIVSVTFLLNTGSHKIDMEMSQQDTLRMKPQEHYFERNLSHYNPSEVLLPYTENTPDTVHVLWCGLKWFEFKHFLSLLSIMKVQQPSKVIIHYWDDNKVLRDRNDYNLWYSQLLDEYYNIVTRSRGPTAPDCEDNTIMMENVLDILKNGGIYVNDTIVLTHHLHHLRKLPLSVGVTNKNVPVTFKTLAYLVAKKGEATSEKLQSLRGDDFSSSCAVSGKTE